MKKFLNKKVIVSLISIIVILLLVIGIYKNSENRLLEKDRYWASYTLLNNNKILVAGGQWNDWNKPGVVPSEIYDVKTGKSEYTIGDLKIPRYHHKAILLNDGRVLIVGGATRDFQKKKDINFIKQAELYNPETGEFTLTGESIIDRSRSFSLTKLKDGKVLFFSGNTPEIYDPETGKFTISGKTNEYLYSEHTATLLKDGRVLIVGGARGKDKNGTYLNLKFDTAEIYDPKTQKFSYTGQLNIPRRLHIATLLKDGRVFIAYGGEKKRNVGVEIYDPKTGKFELVGKNILERNEPPLILLPDGKVAIIGNDWHYDYYRYHDGTIEIFNPEDNSIKLSKKKIYPKRRIDNAFLSSDNKTIIIIGDQNTKVDYIKVKEIE